MSKFWRTWFSGTPIKPTDEEEEFHTKCYYQPKGQINKKCRWEKRDYVVQDRIAEYKLQTMKLARKRGEELDMIPVECEFHHLGVGSDTITYEGLVRY